MPRASHAPNAVVKALNDYIRNGRDRHDGRPMLHAGRVWAASKAGTFSIGPWTAGRLPGSTDSACLRIVNSGPPLDETKTARAVRIEGVHGEPVWGVNVRAVEANERLLVNLLNLSRESRPVRLVTKTTARHALSLMDGKKMEFPLTLSPLEPVLLELKFFQTAR